MVRHRSRYLVVNTNKSKKNQYFNLGFCEDADILKLTAGENPEPRFPLFWRRALELEMVTRVTRYVLADILEGQDDVHRAPAAALTTFLNALLGTEDLTSPNTQEIDEVSKEPVTSGTVMGGSKRRKKRNQHKSGRSATDTDQTLGSMFSGLFQPSICVSHDKLWQSIRTQVAI